MKRAWIKSLTTVDLLVLMIFFTGPASLAESAGEAAAPAQPNAELINQGRDIYERNCAPCHGSMGDGQGMAAMLLQTKPMNFQSGLFKFRSTPTGALPMDEDIFQTISRGLRGTGMIGQKQLSESELRAVVAYLKTLSQRFQQEQPQPLVSVPPPPPQTPEMVAQGRELYQQVGCIKCHGPEGRGDGPSSRELKDATGSPIRPANFSHPLKRGSSPEAVYRTLITGLNGTPMSSYQGTLSEEQLWALAFYVASLNTNVLSEQQRREEANGQMATGMSLPR
ncbi:MAG: c-type cytochrome [Candidatus Tectomicrobia bacterium]|uniref:C-type cytochrome n=1 Tax=Tectimicrobiota bacterium TaxID=2528274 RepID=A0A932CQI3_UNCTE|nr:c-type cytochrome [Candidatus Tectomicrobia bacterium]